MSTASGHTPLSSRRAWVIGVASLVVLAILLVLGSWQVQRLGWKEDLLATIDARIHAAPVEIAEAERLFPDIEYLPVRAEGRFVHEAERHFFTTHRGMSGYTIHTPLILDDSRAIFVNRGFVPYERKDAQSRLEGQLEGEANVTGLARIPPSEKPSFIVPDNDPDANLFYWKDLETMRASSGLASDIELLPFILDADDTPVPGGLPLGGTTIVDLPNNHLQYAVTWFGLAAALIFVWGYWLVRRLRSAP